MLEDAWKLLLCNQFHDIIPGSSIHWANEDCLHDHELIAAATGDQIFGAQMVIADQIDTAGMKDPRVIFNAASHDRHDLIEIRRPAGPVLVPVDVPACG